MGVVDLYLSGATSDGGTQTDPEASLGDHRSSSIVGNNVNITNPVNVTGVVIDKISAKHNFKPVTGIKTGESNTVNNAGLATPTGAATWQAQGGGASLVVNSSGVKGDVAFVDTSGNSKVITTVADAQADTFDSAFGGKSVRFDSGDWISYGASDNHNLGPTGSSNDWTIDWWISLDTTATHEWFGNFDGTNGWRFGLEVNTIRIFAGGAESQISWTPNTNEWYHIAVVKSGTTITVYIDGISIGTFTDKDMSTGTGVFGYGNGRIGTGSNFAGYMANLRITKGTALWSTTFVPPTEITDTDVAFLSRPDGAVGTNIIDDESLNGAVGTNTNTPVIDDESPADTSIIFDGTGDYLHTPDHAHFAFGSGAFTISLFYKTTTSSVLTIVSHWEDVDSNNRSWGLFTTAGGLVQFIGSSDGTSVVDIDITSTTVTNDGAWHHIEIISTGTAQMLFIDGIKEGTDDAFSGTLHDSNGLMMIGGKNSVTPITLFNGSLDNIYLVKGVALHTSNFTAPTERVAALQTIEFTSFGESVRSEDHPISSTDEISRSNIQTSFLKIDTGIGGSGSSHSITVNDAVGVLTYTNIGTLLQYTAPDDTIGTSINVGAGGTFEISSNDNSLFINVTVTGGSLPGSNQVDNLTITQADNNGNIFDNLLQIVADTGQTDYRAIYIKNNSGSLLSAFGVYIEQESLNLEESYEVAIEKPTDGRSLFLDMDGADTSTTFTDKSDHVHAVTAVGDAQVDTTATDAFGGNAGVLLLDGTGDYLQIEDHPSFKLGPDFTIDFFVKTTSALTEILISQWKFTGGNEIAWRIFTVAGAVLFEGSMTGSSSSFIITSSSTINDGSWHHIRAVKSGSVEMLFIDGVKEGTDGAISGLLANIAQPVLIGSQDPGNEANFFTGSIDDLYIVQNRAISTSNFTPRSAAEPTVIDTFIQPVVDKLTAPVDLTFSQPTFEAPLNIDQTDLADGEIYGIRIKRIIPASSTLINNNTFQIGLKYSFI